MATTRIIPMHANRGKSVARCLTERTDYAKNPAKTGGGKFISAFECAPETADAQFLLAKREYFSLTGRRQQSDVIAYQLRQSFLPGEITPQEANQIGYELALRFTKGRHAFLVCTHTDRHHIHNHIIWNSTSLDCTRKFRNFWGSGEAVRRLSDTICLEHGKSVIEHPGKSGKQYGAWLGADKKLTQRDRLRAAIDAALADRPENFDALLERLRGDGFEIRTGKYLALRGPGQERFIRLRSLGEGYGEAELRAALKGDARENPFRSWASKQKAPEKLSLLIDIQEKLKDGKGPGYERWAKGFNLKQMAQTLNFLSENELLDYAALKKKALDAGARFAELSAQIKASENRLTEIAALENQIVSYSKTREVYAAYRAAGYSKAFREVHAAEIEQHRRAKEAFDRVGGKIPTMQELKAQYADELEKKRQAYAAYKAARAEMQEVLIAKANVDRILGLDEKKDRPDRGEVR